MHKFIIATAFVAFSTIASAAMAEDGEALVIYAKDQADALQQLEAAQKDAESPVIIYIVQPQPQESESLQRDVGSITISL